MVHVLHAALEYCCLSEQGARRLDRDVLTCIPALKFIWFTTPHNNPTSNSVPCAVHCEL